MPCSAQDDPNYLTQIELCYSTTAASSDDSSVVGPFDTLFAMFWTMFSMSTTDDWQVTQNLYRSIDSAHFQITATALFPLFVIIIPLTMVNVFLTSLVRAYPL
jgi:hypothetical protein